MKAPWQALGLPLLTKELLEQAARRRTYIVRSFYACLLFLAAGLFFWESIPRRGGLANNPFAVLGHGRLMFEMLVGLQFTGIYLFMPALMCGAIAGEKERNSISLLFLTRLGPSTILLEKYLSRLVPMFTFLLLSLPLLAFTYALGGISQAYLWSGVWSLAITALQVGALALACSAFFRTTVSAFIGCYVIGSLMMFFLPICYELHWFGLYDLVRHLENNPPPFLVWAGYRSRDAMLMFFGPFAFFESFTNSTFVGCLMRSIPLLISTAVCLMFARLFIVHRAFVQPKNFLLKFFKGLDTLFTKLNENRVTRGIVLVNELTRLPQDEPVAWRETTKKSLGTVRYLVRVLLVLEFPIVLVCLLIVIIGHRRMQLEEVSVMLFFLWLIAVLLVSVMSASLVAGERSRETLDVLLTTPMTSREIILQKAQGIRRLMIVLLVPFLTLFFFETWWYSLFTSGDTYYGRGSYGGPSYLLCSLLSVGIYLPLVSWFSLWVGLKVRSQTRAIFGALAGLVAWCVIPFVLFAVLMIVTRARPNSGIGLLMLFSPATIVPVNEFNEYHDIFAGERWSAIIMNFVFYGACLFVLRVMCLSKADRLLGRGET